MEKEKRTFQNKGRDSLSTGQEVGTWRVSRLAWLPRQRWGDNRWPIPQGWVFSSDLTAGVTNNSEFWAHSFLCVGFTL